MYRQRPARNIRPIMLLCMLMSPAGLLMSLGPKAAVAAADAAAADGTAEPISAPITANAFREAVDAFTSRMENPYDMSGLFGVATEQLKQMGVPEQYIRAAEIIRNQFRQRLLSATDGSFLANLTATGDNNSVIGSLLGSSTPMVLAQDGTPMLPELQSFVLFLGQKLLELMKQAGAGGIAEAVAGLSTDNLKAADSPDGAAAGNIAEAFSGAAGTNMAELLAKLGSGKIAESLSGAAGGTNIAELLSKLGSGNIAESLAGAAGGKSVADILSELSSGNIAETLSGAAGGNIADVLSKLGSGNVVESMSGAADGNNIAELLSKLGLGNIAELLAGAAGGNGVADTLSKLGSGNIAETLSGAAGGNIADVLSKLGSGNLKAVESLDGAAAGNIAEALSGASGSNIAGMLSKLVTSNIGKSLAGAVGSSNVADMLPKLGSGNIAEALAGAAGDNNIALLSKLGLGNIAESLAGAAGGNNIADVLSKLGSGDAAEALSGAAGGNNIADMLAKLGSGNVAETLSGAAGGSNIADMSSKLGSGNTADSLDTLAGVAGLNMAETIAKLTKGDMADMLADADPTKVAEALTKLTSGDMTELLPNLAGRKLMEVDTAEADEGVDAVAAAVHSIERVKGYLFSLAEMADEVFMAEKAWNEANGVTSENTEEVLQASHRRLQQADNPFDGYATAFRYVFSTLIDFFRANGLYGLVPLIADVRGIFNRYNWIGDLLQLVSTPVENFVNANYFPLPQSNDDAIKLGKKLLADFCKFEKVEDSEHVLGKYTGPKLTVELKPFSCPIYKDKLYGRSYISFADCEAAKLVITVTPLEINGPHHTAATYTSNECKYTETYGIDTTFGLGGGEGAFTFTRSAQGIDIVPTVIQVSPNLRFFSSNGPAAGGGDIGPTGGPGIQVTTSATVTDPPRVVTAAGPTVQRANLTDNA